MVILQKLTLLAGTLRRKTVSKFWKNEIKFRKWSDMLRPSWNELLYLYITFRQHVPSIGLCSSGDPRAWWGDTRPSKRGRYIHNLVLFFLAVFWMRLCVQLLNTIIGVPIVSSLHSLKENYGITRWKPCSNAQLMAEIDFGQLPSTSTTSYQKTPSKNIKLLNKRS